MGKDKDSQIIEAATSVFLRYGFRRTTMADLAGAAGLSRPALYLRYCNKEKIFETVLKDFAARTLEDIRAGLPNFGTPQEQLRFAFECWAVRPFTMMRDSPDAKDLTHCCLGFAETVKVQSQAAFEAILAGILEALPAFRGKADALAATAHVLAASVHGFKVEARTDAELRAMIETLLALVAAPSGYP
jgi:AcrR family transcriptional regulator